MYLHSIFLNLFFNVSEKFIADFSRQQIEKGKIVILRFEYNGLNLHFPYTKCLILCFFVPSEILTASEEQLQCKSGATEGGIETWAGLWGRTNLVLFSSGTVSFVLWLGDTQGEGSLFCLYI